MALQIVEWLLPNPGPRENFKRVPRIIASPYGYGVKDAPVVAVLRPPVAAVVGKSPS